MLLNRGFGLRLRQLLIGAPAQNARTQFLQIRRGALHLLPTSAPKYQWQRKQR